MAEVIENAWTRLLVAVESDGDRAIKRATNLVLGTEPFTLDDIRTLVRAVDLVTAFQAMSYVRGAEELTQKGEIASTFLKNASVFIGHQLGLEVAS